MCATWALCVLFCISITYRPVPQYCWHPGRGFRSANVLEVPKQCDNNKANKKLDPATRQPYRRGRRKAQEDKEGRGGQRETVSYTHLTLPTNLRV